MGNNFSQAATAFIVNSARSGDFLFNLLKKLLIWPLYPVNTPRIFQEREGSGITQWENSARHIGSVQVNSFEDATKSIIYLLFHNPEMDRVLTIAILQAKRCGSQPEMFFYVTKPDSDEVMGTRFQTRLTTQEFREFFNQMM